MSVYLVHAESQHTLAAFPDRSIHVLFYDGPYGVNYQSNHRRNKLEPIYNDSILKARATLTQTTAMAHKLVAGGSFLIWTNLANPACWFVAGRHVLEHIDNPPGHFEWESMTRMYHANTITWIKTHYTNGADWREQSEHCLHMYRGPKLRWPNGVHDQGNIIVCPRPAVPDGSNATPKPIRVCAHVLKPLIAYGDIVVDPVCGGGASLATAKLLGAGLVVGGDCESPEIERAAASLTKHSIEYQIVTLDQLKELSHAYHAENRQAV